MSIAKANGKESIEDVPTFDETKDLIAGLTAERLEELVKNDLICVVLDINPKSVSYIPCGWILAEKAKEGDGTDLIYGIRKSVFKSSQANKTSYQFAQRIFDKSGKLFSKTMKEIFGPHDSASAWHTLLALKQSRSMRWGIAAFARPRFGIQLVLGEYTSLRSGPALLEGCWVPICVTSTCTMSMQTSPQMR